MDKGQGPISVLIVDDQALFRRAAASVIGATPGFEVVAQAASGEEAVELASILEPALILMDINMTGINGIEATRQIIAKQPQAVIVLLSTYALEDLPSDAQGSGMASYVNKEDFGPEVLTDIWAVHHR